MNKLANGFVWKLMERVGVQGVQFILQIILARLLAPAHYGVLSLMLVFINLANVFIQNGFNTSLIQNKDVTEEDYSSVFWVTLGIAGLLYVVIFLASPFIASFYKMPSLVAPLRAISLILFPGAFNSIQLAMVSRKLDFKNVFFSNIGGVIISGIVGIALAYSGAGIWALVWQYIVNNFVVCVIMFYTVRWRPRIVINWDRIKILFSFGWKLLVSGLLNTLYQDLQSLVIGKKYDEGTLGYCNRGKQFPQFLITAINSTVQSVMLPAMSAKQDSPQDVKKLTRQSVTISSYIIFPMMAGLAGVAEPVVRMLLTEKWVPCVPYMQIYCFALAFYPVHSCNLQAINAMGRSDIFLKLEFEKKAASIIFLIGAVVFFDDPISIALTSILTMPISMFINASPNKKMIGYSYMEQVMDILPTLLASLSMFVIVQFIGRIDLNTILLLIIQIAVGVLYYIIVSFLLRIRGFISLLSIIKFRINKERD